MDQAESIVGEDLHLQAAAREEVVQPLKPELHGLGNIGRKRGTPLTVHAPFCCSGSLDIERAQGRVADYADAGSVTWIAHFLQSLTGNFQKRGAKESGDPVILPGTIQVISQKILQRAAPGGIATDHRLSPSTVPSSRWAASVSFFQCVMDPEGLFDR